MNGLERFLSKTTVALIVSGCFIVATAYAAVVGNASARTEQLHTQKLRAQAAVATARQRHLQWATHLRRKAWNDAHPEVIAARRAAAAALAKREERAEAVAAEAQRKQQALAYKMAHACGTADSYEHQAMSDINSDAYQSAYKNANSGLTYAENCDDETDQLVDKAYLLTIRGFAEHDLTVGDSRTDLNQANTLLVECQTKPGLYGTKQGAECETQEQNNIRAQTNWDLDSY